MSRKCNTLGNSRVCYHSGKANRLLLGMAALANVASITIEKSQKLRRRREKYNKQDKIWNWRLEPEKKRRQTTSGAHDKSTWVHTKARRRRGKEIDNGINRSGSLGCARWCGGKKEEERLCVVSLNIIRQSPSHRSVNEGIMKLLHTKKKKKGVGTGQERGGIID